MAAKFVPKLELGNEGKIAWMKEKQSMGRRIEDDLVREIAEQLRPRTARIWAIKKPYKSDPFKKRIKARLGYVPILQPDIDLCILSEDGQLFAVEAKLFRGDKLTYKMPFYEGIGQALALHRFGFDAVALWFLFQEGANIEGLNRYGAEAWAFVRNDLSLPLDFSYISVRQQGTSNVFAAMQYTGRQTGYEIGLPLNHPDFRIEWRHRNPIRCFPVQQALRETLEWWLKI